MNSLKSSNRDAKWDNIKCLLMFTVVIGHILYNYLDCSALTRSVYLIFYSFHMPVFIFISGMFSKGAVKEKQYNKILFYLVIYLLMKFLQSLYTFLAGGNFVMRFFWEAGPGWYALAMSVFLAVMMLIEKFLPEFDKGKLLILAFFVGIIWGFDDHIGDHYASARILTFFPFFLMGYYSDSFKITKLTRSLKIKIPCIALLLAGVIVAIYQIDNLWWMIKPFKGKFAFSEMDVDIWMGPIARIAAYAITIVVGFAIIAGEALIPAVWPIHYELGAALLACVIVLITATTPFVRSMDFIKYITGNNRPSQRYNK